jgi:hypothetical protein
LTGAVSGTRSRYTGTSVLGRNEMHNSSSHDLTIRAPDFLFGSTAYADRNAAALDDRHVHVAGGCDALGRSMAGARVGGAGRGGREPDTRIAEREAGGALNSGRAGGSGSGDETKFTRRFLERLWPGKLCYHGTCLPDNMLASDPPPRTFLSLRSPNARAPWSRSVGSAVCRRIRGSFRDSPSDR